MSAANVGMTKPLETFISMNFRKIKSNYREIAKANYFEKCYICGSTEKLQVHHINGDHNDNRPQNLAYVCLEHHCMLHRKRIPDFREDLSSNGWRRNLEWNRR
jgi:predicted restriction endonuclease